jgi:hypothetical protein
MNSLKTIFFPILFLIIISTTGNCQLFYDNNKLSNFSDFELLNDSIKKKKSKYSDHYISGRMDAMQYYNDSRAFAVSFATSLLLPPVGFITTIAISTSEPKTENLNVPNEQLLKNDEYMKGYIHKAKKMKAGKAWGGCATGLAFFGIAYLILYGAN